MTTDSKGLDAIADQIITFARARNIALVPGFARDHEAGVVIQCTAAEFPGGVDADRAGKFIVALERLDIALIAMQILEFNEKRWRSAVQLIQSGLDLYRDLGNQAARAALDGVLAETKSARRHLGSTASVAVTVVARNPTMIIEWVEMTDWHRAITDAEDDILADAEHANADDDDDRGALPPDDPFAPPPPGGRRARRTH